MPYRNIFKHKVHGNVKVVAVPGQGSVIVVEPLDRHREWSMSLDFSAVVWSGSGIHTDTPTIRGRAVPPWIPALEVRPVRPAERAAWRTLMATHHYWGVRGLVGESLG